MMIPTIHLNGTSRDELQRQLIAAIEAVRGAVETVAKAGPHGRDYYPQGPDAINTALAEHYARLEKLDAVYKELCAIGEEIAF